MHTHPFLIATLGLSLLLCACSGTRTLANPMLSIQTEHGRELGVSTDYGVVFLGRTARSGEAEVTAWFGDGPNIEATVIEPIGGGLYTAETEILLPSVAMSFEDPRPGAPLVILGFDGRRSWRIPTAAVGEKRVEGIVLRIPKRLKDAPDQVGAGVFVVSEEDENDLKLVGLVSGKLRIETPNGMRDYLTVVGPRTLWRLVAHRRDLRQRRRWIYREDIL